MIMVVVYPVAVALRVGEEYLEPLREINTAMLLVDTDKLVQLIAPEALYVGVLPPMHPWVIIHKLQWVDTMGVVFKQVARFFVGGTTALPQPVSLNTLAQGGLNLVVFVLQALSIVGTGHLRICPQPVPM